LSKHIFNTVVNFPVYITAKLIGSRVIVVNSIFLYAGLYSVGILYVICILGSDISEVSIENPKKFVISISFHCETFIIVNQKKEIRIWCIES